MEIDKPEFTAPGGPEEREENDETTKVTYKSMKYVHSVTDSFLLQNGSDITSYPSWIDNAFIPNGYAKMLIIYYNNRKKYRKMRLKFDQKMNQSNVWYKQEQEAAETARRLALENELV